MEPPDTDEEPLTRAEWAAFILMGFGLLATIALAALRMWRCEAGAVGLVWAGVYLLGKTFDVPQVIHNHLSKTIPRGT